MFNDTYVFVVFEDGTDIYWARSRVVEYLQTIARADCLRMFIRQSVRTQLARAGCTNMLSWTTATSTASPICGALQDWHLRYQLETVPGVAEVASIGGFVRQYQVKLDPNKLLALRHSSFDRD